MRANNSIIMAGVLGAPLMLVLFAQTADAAHRPFCSSVVGVCVHTGPDAPVLNANVCWNGTYASLMSGATCPSGTKPYFLNYGLVDPMTAIVTGYIPHDDACSVEGLCAAFEPHEGGWESPICCNGGICWPGTDCSGGTLYYCWDGVTNEDGTVTCFDAEEV